MLAEGLPRFKRQVGLPLRQRQIDVLYRLINLSRVFVTDRYRIHARNPKHIPHRLLPVLLRSSHHLDPQ